MEPLIAALRNSNDNCRADAARALSKIGDERAVEPLIVALQDSLENIHHTTSEDTVNTEVYVMANTASALRAIGGNMAVDAILAASRDEDERVRYKIAVVALDIENALVVPRLEEALDEEDLPVIAGAYGFYIKLGRAGSEHLLISALNKHGEKWMAESFLNCGNVSLSDAAREWAQNNGYDIMPSLGNAPEYEWGIGE